MGFNFKKFIQGIRLTPVSTDTTSQLGDLQANSADNYVHLNNGSSSSPIVTISHADQAAHRLQNKDLEDISTAVVNSADTTKKLNFSNVGATTNTQTTIDTVQTANRVITLPDATDTLVGINATQTLSNKSLVDNSTQIIGHADATKELNFNVSGATTGTETTITASQTVNRVLTLPDATDTLTANAATQTLTNKTINASNNTISNITNSNIASGAAISRSKISPADANYVVVNDGSGNLTDVASISISQGGTGQSTASAGFNALSPITSAGDLIIGNGSNSATRLPIGSNAFVLTSNATTASWQPNTPSFSGLNSDGVIYAASTTTVSSTTVGTSGQILTSNGSGNAPTFQTPITNTYFSGYLYGAQWSTNSSTPVQPTNSGTNTLSTKFSHGITVTAAGGNTMGINFTPPTTTAVYFIECSFSIKNSTAGNEIGVNFRDAAGPSIQTTFFQDSSNSQFAYVRVGGIFAPGTTSPSGVQVYLFSPQGGTVTTADWSSSSYENVTFTILQITP